MPELVPIDAVRPSTYNPRTADPARLDLIELSLRKLGWLFPIYATRAGEILSGHQRHLVAERMGAGVMPVEWVDDLGLDGRKVVNVLFNRATNEMTASTSTTKLRDEILDADPQKLAARLSDVRDPYPCLSAVDCPVRELIERVGPERNQYGATVNGALDRRVGVRMPIICSANGELLNGLGRLRYYFTRGVETVPVVEVAARRGRLAALLLNKLSMDFDINERYADLLRHNSFRRTHQVRKSLGLGFLHEIGATRTDGFDIGDRRDRQRWVAAYGESVVDFGAGLLVETRMLRDAGVRVSAFEPYPCGEDKQVSTDLSRDLAREFLRDVASEVRWSSVFCSSVLNSVPFQADREHIAVILAALAWPDAPLYAHARSTTASSWRNVRGAEYHNRGDSSAGGFELDYEPGIALALGPKPKVQKFHTDEEFRALFEPHFEDVRSYIGVATSLVAVRCRSPRKPRLGRLDEALNFEFDLPMPDGRRLGLGREARAAFRDRLRRRAC